MTQVEITQIQPRQAGVKISDPCDDDVDARSSNGSAVGAPIDKLGSATLRHRPIFVRRAAIDNGER
jgi:hypothetical protein